MSCYGPDGAWPEGVGYWAYATEYLAIAASALFSAQGAECGLLGQAGFPQTAAYLLAATGPTGAAVAFGDVGVHLPRIIGHTAARLPAIMWWLADASDVATSRLVGQALSDQGPPANAAEMFWFAAALVRWPHASERAHPASVAPRALHIFGGEGAIAILRSDMHDDQALWVALKGGSNAVNHAHHDLGSIEVEALCARWITDLGSDSYALPGYFDARPGGHRWTWFRTRAQAHNLVLLDGQDQSADGAASFLPVQAGTDAPAVILDASSAYGAPATSTRRGVRIAGGSLVVQDELKLSSTSDLTWGLNNGADIALAGDEATLSLVHRTLRVRILSPPGACFSLGNLARPPPEASNAGVHRLEIRIAAPQGLTTIAVALTPRWPDRRSTAIPPMVPLDLWPAALAKSTP